MTPEDARRILRDLAGQNPPEFHALHSTAVELLLKTADRYKYRTPRNANGSRARYYYEHLQRLARRPPGRSGNDETAHYRCMD